MQMGYGPGSGSNSSHFAASQSGHSGHSHHSQHSAHLSHGQSSSHHSQAVAQHEPGSPEYLLPKPAHEVEDSVSCQTEFELQGKDPGAASLKPSSMSMTTALKIETEMTFEQMKPAPLDEAPEHEDGDDSDDAMAVLESISPGGDLKAVKQPDAMKSEFSIPKPPQRRQKTSNEPEGSAPPSHDDDDDEKEEMIHIESRTPGNLANDNEDERREPELLLKQMKALADQSSPGIGGDSDDEVMLQSTTTTTSGGGLTAGGPTRGGPTPPPPEPPIQMHEEEEEEAIFPPPQPERVPSEQEEIMKITRTTTMETNDIMDADTITRMATDHDAPAPPQPPIVELQPEQFSISPAVSASIVKQTSSEKREIMDSVSANIDVSALLPPENGKPEPPLPPPNSSESKESQQDIPAEPLEIVRPEKKGQTMAMLSVGMKEQYALYVKYKESERARTSWMKSTNKSLDEDAFSDYQQYQSWRLKTRPQTTNFKKQMTYKQFTSARTAYAVNGASEHLNHLNHSNTTNTTNTTKVVNPPSAPSTKSIAKTEPHSRSVPFSQVSKPQNAGVFSKALAPNVRGPSVRRKSAGKAGKPRRKKSVLDRLNS